MTPEQADALMSEWAPTMFKALIMFMVAVFIIRSILRMIFGQDD